VNSVFVGNSGKALSPVRGCLSSLSERVFIDDAKSYYPGQMIFALPAQGR